MLTESDKKAYIDWVDRNAKTTSEVLLGFSCCSHLGSKNLSLDLRQVNLDWFEYEGGFFKKSLKKSLVKAIKQLQRKGVIEIVSSKSWHEYTVNIHNPLTK